MMNIIKIIFNEYLARLWWILSRLPLMNTWLDDDKYYQDYKFNENLTDYDEYYQDYL